MKMTWPRCSGSGVLPDAPASRAVLVKAVSPGSVGEPSHEGLDLRVVTAQVAATTRTYTQRLRDYACRFRTTRPGSRLRHLTRPIGNQEARGSFHFMNTCRSDELLLVVLQPLADHL